MTPLILSCFPATASKLGFIVKGMLIYVEGRLKTRSWDDDGIKRYRTELIAQQVQFLSKIDRQPMSVNPMEQDEADIGLESVGQTPMGIEDLPF